MNEVQAEIKKRKGKNASKDDKDELFFATWTKEQEDLLAEWAEKASCYRWLHGRAEKKYRCRNYAFTIPVIVMSTLTGTANFAMDSFVPEEHKKMAMAGVGGVNILAGIISTLQNFLRFAELMESHRSSGISWSKLNRDICVELALDPARRKPAGTFLDVCRAEYDRLIEQSPMIDDTVLKHFHENFHDTDINKPEMCNGLDKCEIYQPTKEERTSGIVSSAAEKLTHMMKSPFSFDTPNSLSKEQETHRTELSGLSSMGKVSGMRKLIVQPTQTPEESKQKLHSELTSILTPNDIETNLEQGESEKEVEELDQESKDFLSAIIDEETDNDKNDAEVQK